MLCTRCLYRLAPPVLFRPSTPRVLTTTRAARSSTTDSSSPAIPSDPPALSTPTINSSPSSRATASALPGETPPLKSKTKVGTVLRGLGYVNGNDKVVAREDHEYPDWLWGLLDKKDEMGDGDVTDGGAGDEFSKSKKQRRIAAKATRKATARDPSLLIPKVPLEYQTIDLPVAAEGGSSNVDGEERGWEEAQRAREGLTEAMRRSRRKKIKQENFLKTMK